MKWLTWLVLFLPAIALAQQPRLPDIGKIMKQSKDYKANEALRDGCTLQFNKGTVRFDCSEALEVTLTQGYSTVVTNSRVHDTSHVRCGCEADGNTTTTSCDDVGRWLAGYRVTTVAEGTFTVSHAYALGGEKAVCVIE